MESQRVKDILPAVIGNIQSYKNTTDKKTKHAIRYGMRRLIQYATEAEPKIISQRALSICQSKGIDWTKLKRNVPSGIKGKPAVLGDHSEPLMELVWSIYGAEEAQIDHGVSSPEKTAVIGSSMGGLATLYAAIQHPDKFRTALALSPHWVISDENFARSMVEALPLTHKIWMSRGDKGLDKEYVQLQNFVDSLMRKRGFTNNFESKVYKRSGHNERSWAKYLQEPLRFWLSA